MTNSEEIYPQTIKVRYAEMLPYEFRNRLADKPLAYLPLGTLEWHGEHLPLGSDGIISQSVMEEAARRFGGIVLPPIHLGPDRTQQSPAHGELQGMDFLMASSPGRRLEGSCYWVPEEFFTELIERILVQLKRAGFKAVFADGHGPSRIAWGRHKGDQERKLGLILLGVADLDNGSWLSQIDHAAKNETSLVLAVRPDLVDLPRLPADRSSWPVAVDGEDPRDASAGLGKEWIEISLSALQTLLARRGL
jgi:creatinine amidohydrolase